MFFIYSSKINIFYVDKGLGNLFLLDNMSNFK